METTVKCSGDLEKLLIEHRKNYYPHLTSWGSYLFEMAKQKAEADIRGNREKK